MRFGSQHKIGAENPPEDALEAGEPEHLGEPEETEDLEHLERLPHLGSGRIVASESAVSARPQLRATGTWSDGARGA
jgi:hypothetical protein